MSAPFFNSDNEDEDDDAFQGENQIAPFSLARAGPKNLSDAMTALIFSVQDENEEENNNVSQRQQEEILRKLNECDPSLLKSARKDDDEEEDLKRFKLGFPKKAIVSTSENKNHDAQLLSLGFLTAAGKQEHKRKQKELIESVCEFEQGLKELEEMISSCRKAKGEKEEEGKEQAETSGENNKRRRNRKE